jgi:hypothetical protein
MLTTLDTVKARLGITDTVDDTLLTTFIRAISDRFDRHCQRRFARAEGALDEFRGDDLMVAVQRYPVEIVIGFELKADEAEGWVSVESPVHQLRSGCVIELQSPLGTYWDQARVMYTGGYVLPGTVADPLQSQTALPADVEAAAVEEVSRWYQHRNRVGVASISGEGSSVTLPPVSVVSPVDLLPATVNTLEKYRRYVL